jgi:hypothetical protein
VSSDDFVFDNQMLAQILWHGRNIGEVSCPTKNFPEASSIYLRRNVEYGCGCLATAIAFRLAKWRLATPPFRTWRFKLWGVSAHPASKAVNF